MTSCPRCGLRLTAGRCPADLPTLPTHAGREYGTAQQLVHRLGADVTVGMVRNWHRRDHLIRVRMAGADGRPEVRYPLDQAAAIEAAKRRSGRGRRRAGPAMSA